MVPLFVLVEQIFAATTEAIGDVQWLELSAVVEQHRQKRLTESAIARGAMPVLVSWAVGGETPSAVPLAACRELYTLAANIFDDLADRDRPTTVWATWPVPKAMNVGIGLWLAGQNCLSQLETNGDAQRAILHILSQGLLHMAHGQAHPPAQPVFAQYFQHNAAKSGLFYAAFAQAAARLHTTAPRILQAALEYGMALGAWEQLQNDSLGSVGSDLSRGHYTFPVLLGLALEKHPAQPRLRALVEDYRGRALDEAAQTTLRQLLQDMQLPAYQRQMAATYRAKGQQAAQLLTTDAALLALLDLPFTEMA